MKYIIVVGDGMADYPVGELEGKTPLMVARTPTMAQLAQRGQMGQLLTLPPDLPKGSAVANLSILGYDPHLYFRGRGVLEAASLGLKLDENDLAMRMNFITLEHGTLKSHSAGHISTQEAAILLDACQKEFSSEKILLHLGKNYRHIAIIPQGDESFTTYPPHDHIGEKAEELLPKPLTSKAEKTTQLLTQLIRHSWQCLSEHPINQQRLENGQLPANSLWFWSQGRPPNMPTLQEKYGLSGAVVAAVDLIQGLGAYAGMEIIHVDGATGLFDTNYEGKAAAALEALQRHDLVFVHVEATDEAGHEKNLPLKIRCIEALDQRLLKPLLQGIKRMPFKTAIALLPDHATPVERGDHVRDPVPFLIAHPHRKPDQTTRYDEKEALKGSLGLLQGTQFIETLLSFP